MRTLVARLDSDGDVLLAGPAVRAAAHAGEVVLLCGHSGAQAAELLPGVQRVVRWDCPWIAYPAPDVRTPEVEGIVALLKGVRADVALILTSFHQSPLPLALLLKLAGVPKVVARSTDYPGSLLDVRLRDDPDLPEAERALEVARSAGDQDAVPRRGRDAGRVLVLARRARPPVGAARAARVAGRPGRPVPRLARAGVPGARPPVP